MHSLSAKLLYIYIGITLFSLISFSIIIYTNLETDFYNSRKEELSRKANISATYIAENRFLERNNTIELKKEVDSIAEQMKVRVEIIDTHSNILVSSLKEHAKINNLTDVVSSLKGEYKIYKTENSEIKLFFPLKDSKDKVVGVIYIVDDNEAIKSILGKTIKKLYWLIIITSVVMGIIILALSSIITLPIKRILKVIEKMIEGRFDQKIKVTGHDELSELSMAFNQMSAKLQKVDASRQEFVANVSHELKTPLSSMKVLIESLLFQENVPEEMYKEFLSDTNSEIDRLTEIINSLLVLVKLDRKVVPIDAKNINVSELVKDIVKRMKPLADKKEIDLIFEEVKEVNAEVDKIKISLAITNLIENGIKYNNVEEGYVKVKVDSDHQNVYVTIEDNGMGIAEEEQNKIFDRFYRIDKTRDRDTGGTGLGLAITHRTVILHNGSIKLVSKENEGTTFIIRLPLKQNKGKE